MTIRDKSGETALMCAARFGTPASMHLLLDYLRSLKLDAHVMLQRNRLGYTALELARVENIRCAKLIARHALQHNLPTDDGECFSPSPLRDRRQDWRC